MTVYVYIKACIFPPYRSDYFRKCVNKRRNITNRQTLEILSRLRCIIITIYNNNNDALFVTAITCRVKSAITRHPSSTYLIERYYYFSQAYYIINFCLILAHVERYLYNQFKSRMCNFLVSFACTDLIFVATRCK